MNVSEQSTIYGFKRHEAVSGEKFLVTANYVGIAIPATTTALTIQVSNDEGETFENVRTKDGDVWAFDASNKHYEGIECIKGQYLKLTFTGTATIKCTMG